MAPRSVLNSWWSLFKIIDKKFENFDEINQKEGNVNIKIKNELNQFKGSLKLADGSNTLNRLVIIVS